MKTEGFLLVCGRFSSSIGSNLYGDSYNAPSAWMQFPSGHLVIRPNGSFSGIGLYAQVTENRNGLCVSPGLETILLAA